MSLDSTPTLPFYRWDQDRAPLTPGGPAERPAPQPWSVPTPPYGAPTNAWAGMAIPARPEMAPVPGWPQPPATPVKTSGRTWALVGASVGVVVLAALASGLCTAVGHSHQSASATAHNPTAAVPSSQPAPVTPAPPPPAPLVPSEALSGLLLDPASINRVMGSRDLVVNPTLTTAKLYIDTTDKPECGGVWANANKTAYAGSGWESVQTQYLREQDKPQHEVYQSVVSFPSAQAATDLVATEAKRWPLCNGKPITTTNHEAPPQTWSITTVNQQGGMLTSFSTREGAQGYGCQHALTARNNVVIDVEACGWDVIQQGTAIADKTAEHISRTT